MGSPAKADTALAMSRGFPEPAIAKMLALEASTQNAEGGSDELFSEGLLKAFLQCQLPDGKWLATLAKQPLEPLLDQLQSEVHKGYLAFHNSTGSSAPALELSERQWQAMQRSVLAARRRLFNNPAAQVFIEGLVINLQAIARA